MARKNKKIVSQKKLNNMPMTKIYIAISVIAFLAISYSFAGYKKEKKAEKATKELKIAKRKIQITDLSVLNLDQTAAIEILKVNYFLLFSKFTFSF